MNFPTSRPSCLMCVLTAFATNTNSNALTITTPLSPATTISLTGGDSGSGRCSTKTRVVFAPLYLYNAHNEYDSDHHESEEEGNDLNGLFKNVGDIFHQMFPNAPEPSHIMSDLTSSLPIVSDFASSFSLPIIDIPGMLLGTSEQRSKASYQKVNEFDADLAKDIEEALRLANDLAAARGLGDMTIHNSVREENEGPFLSRENNAAVDWNRDLLEQKEGASRQSRGREHFESGEGQKKKNVISGDESEKRQYATNAREEKPSLFHENNAADVAPGQGTTKVSSSYYRWDRGNSVMLNGRSYANAADVKPASGDVGAQGERSIRNSRDDRDGSDIRKPLWEGDRYANAADLKVPTDYLGTRGEGSSNNNRGSIDDHNGWVVGKLFGKATSYANAADVKPSTDGSGARRERSFNIGDSKVSGGGENAGRHPEPCVNTANVKHDDAKKEIVGRSYYTRDDDLATSSHSGAKGYVDTATSFAKAAWEEAPPSPKPFVRPHPPMGDPFGSSLPTHSDESSADINPIGRGGNIDSNKSKIGSGEDGKDAVKRRDREEEYDFQLNRQWERQNDRSNFHSSSPDSTSVSTSVRQSRMDKKNARERDKESYSRHKKYLGGDDFDNDNAIQHATTNLKNSRKIVITDSALELARSLKLDIYEVFQFKKRGLDIDMDGCGKEATVKENDVREYLDQRYEQLFSKLKEEKKGRQHQRRTRNGTTRGGRARTPPPVNLVSERSAYGGHHPYKSNWSDFVAKNGWEAFYDDHKKSEDEYGWKKSQFGQHSPKPQPQSRRPPQQQRVQRQEEQSSIQYQNKIRQKTSQSSIIPPISSVSLSELILNPRLKHRLPAQTSTPRSRHSILPPVSSVPLSQLILNPKLERQPSPQESFHLSHSHQRSPKAPISSAPLSQLISNPTPKHQPSPSESFDLQHSQQTSSEEKSRQPYQEQQQRNTALVDDKGDKSFKRISFQEISQSKFREPYQERRAVDHTTMAFKHMPTQTVGLA